MDVLRITRWEVILNYLGGSNIITRKAEKLQVKRYNNRSRGWSDVLEDLTEATGHRTQVDSEAGKGKEIDAPRSSCQLCGQLDLLGD